MNDSSNLPSIEELLPKPTFWQRTVRAFSKQESQVAFEWLCDYHLQRIVAGIMEKAEEAAEEKQHDDNVTITFTYERIPVGLRKQTGEFSVLPAVYKALKEAVKEPCTNVDCPRLTAPEWGKASDNFEPATFTITFRNLRAHHSL